MSQSRLGSAVEAWANIAIGFGVAFLANMVVLPAFGFHISAHQNFVITCVFTVISFIRSYFVRRLFNYIKAFNHHG